MLGTDAFKHGQKPQLQNNFKVQYTYKSYTNVTKN